MSSMQNLNDILNELGFSEREKEGFNQSLQVAQDYMQNGNVDMEKQFTSIVEKVAEDEIQKNKV